MNIPAPLIALIAALLAAVVIALFATALCSCRGADHRPTQSAKFMNSPAYHANL